TVSFNTGFDDITVPSQTVDFDKYITKPEVKKIGYRLDGWYKDKEFNQVFDFVNDTLIKNVTLYAKWTQMSDVVVTFWWCDGTEDTAGTVSTNSVTYGTKVAKPADPVRTGYNFKGWYADEEYKEEFDFDQEITSEVSVYAKWEMNSTPTPTPSSDDVKPTPTPDTPSTDDPTPTPTPTPDTPSTDDPTPTPTPDTPSTDDQNKSDDSNKSTVVRVKPANTYVAGEKINIHELYFPYLSSIDKYRVSDKKTASIGKRGVLKGRRAGTVKVEAIRGKGKKAMVVATCEVTILSKPKLKFKEYTTLGEVDNAYNYFNTADIGTAVDKWQSTKPGVATIDAKTGEIHIVGKGTTKIYAYFGNCKVKAKLKVKPS
nr:InlB B-repeat-containing protein [Lachnospiraceae bacterium]